MKPRRQKQIERERQRRVDGPVPPTLTSNVAPQTTHPEWPSDWLKEPLRRLKASRRTRAEKRNSQGLELCWPRTIGTVSELWQQWANIIDSGPPLEERFPKGVRWVDEPTRQRFERMRPVLNAILGSPDHSKAVTQLETLRVEEGLSLNQLGQALLDERAGRSVGPS